MIETGVLFDNIHSFYDFGLILSAVDIPPAAPKTTYIDIPGGDGSIDLTEALGEIKFSDRVLKFSFAMNPAGDLSETAWEERKTLISNYLNGRLCKITLDKDSDFYWVGRCSVESYASQKRLRQIVISATVRPYKFRQSETIRSYTLTSTAQTIVLRNGRKSVCPVITCTGSDTTVVFDSKTYKLSAGTHKFLNIRLTEGNNRLTISGSGQITFTYQEAEL